MSKIGNLINTNTITLGGDFNALDISWENNQVLIHQATQKKFWAQIKHLKKDDPGVLDLKIDEDIITDDKGKAEI